MNCGVVFNYIYSQLFSSAFAFAAEILTCVHIQEWLMMTGSRKHSSRKHPQQDVIIYRDLRMGVPKVQLAPHPSLSFSEIPWYYINM